jgi:glycosyltransferase involved in cell wall biosynthesis
MIFLLGARDTPVDGVEDYCNCLSAALRQTGSAAEVVRVSWADEGWIRALLQLRSDSRLWRGEWVVLQYNALAWSRRGFPFGAIAVLALLRARRVKIAVVFHDAGPFPVRRLVDRLRRTVQIFVMRSICRRADRVITTIDPTHTKWIRGDRKKYVCIPAGPNVPVVEVHSSAESSRARKTVVVFSLTPGKWVEPEAESIAYIVSKAAAVTAPLQLVVLGRNSEAAAATLRKLLPPSLVELSVLGLLDARYAAEAIAGADVLLFLREGVSSRRSSAIAGIAQGLPVVAYEGPETGFPITEAGLALAPEWNRDALAAQLARVLSDDALRENLRRESTVAREKYFSWDAIARRYLQELPAP